MDTELNAELGKNRTGATFAPKEAVKTKEGAEKLTIPPQGDASLMAENRILYFREADPIGSIPIPKTFKGIANTVKEKIMTGNYALMDKLGERLAFERSGTRLYEALISKYNGTTDRSVLPDLIRIEQFYMEELKHFHMVADVIAQMGGDPTAMTPAADICGTAAMGWIQVINDPRTTFLQSLEIILQAELVDNACWELLIELAEKNGMADVAVHFQQALDEEALHLTTVKQWVLDLVTENKVSMPASNFEIEIDMKDIPDDNSKLKH